jgi:hypothetical protein
MNACLVLVSNEITWYNVFISIFADIDRIKSNVASSRGLTESYPIILKEITTQ